MCDIYNCYILSAGSRYEVTAGNLTINQVRVTDMGNYICMGSNLVGVASAVVEVLVRGELGGVNQLMKQAKTELYISWLGLN